MKSLPDAETLPVTSIGKWQATLCPEESSRNSGTSDSQRA
jgi:hypothetical protein